MIITFLSEICESNLVGWLHTVIDYHLIVIKKALNSETGFI